MLLLLQVQERAHEQAQLSAHFTVFEQHDGLLVPHQ
jgi:hypothetical protein